MKALSNSLKRRHMIRDIHRDYQFYLLIIPAFVYIIIFHYIPMYGVQIAFKDFKISEGIMGSSWAGFEYFLQFFKLHNFWTLLGNTLGISLYSLIVGFPIPIILAVMINEVKNVFFKKTVQMVTYAPHFISVVVMCGMIVLFLNKNNGLINHIVSFLGGTRIDYLSEPQYFKTIFVLSGIWQNSGWGTIIYFAALSGVDPQLIDSSRIDGAGRLQKIWHIDLPAIMPTIVILLILRVGQIMTVGYEKVLLLQNPLNMDAADIIQTYVYRIGLVGAQYSLSSAIGLFNSVINMILLVAVNQLARKINETSLW